ncbi:MAG: flagellar hook-length control protein FliK [Mariprofundaceae bacterium]|nr:flagellar hook-length control protein FliK [Mariprofundaceae bacterium]
MQTGKINFNSPSFIEQAPVQVHLKQNQLPMLQKGDTLQAFVGQIAQGKAQVSIQGETVTLEGISKQFQQKNISLKVLQTQPVVLLELKNDVKNTESIKQQENLTSNALEKTLLDAKIINKMQNSIQKNQAFSVHTASTLSINLKDNKQSYQATAIAKHGLSTTLHINSDKTQPSTNKTTIQITSPTRPIQIGERFSIQNIEHLGSSSKLLLEPLDASKASPNNQAMHKKSINTLGSLAPGKIITANVGERLASGNVILNWQQQRFEASAPEQVRAGDVLQLEVNRDNRTDKPSLRVLNWLAQPKGKAAQLLRQHIGKSDTIQQTLNTLQQISASITPINNNTAGNQALSQSLTSLQNWTDNYALNPEKGMDGPSIASLMRQIGQHFESNLLQHRHATIQQLQQHDFKALLLQLTDHAGALTTMISTQAKNTAERGIAHIESQQALNLLAMIQADPIRFELPMMVQAQWVNVFLSIQQEMYEENSENNHAQSTSHHILFALDLSSLGALRVDAHISDSSVHAKFYHENDGSRQFIQENIQKLQETLKNIGFTDIYLNSAEIKQLNPATALQFQQLTTNAPSSDGLLDIQV